jgi:hypothetical protein
MRCTKQTYLSEAHAEAEQKKVAAIFKKRGGRGYKFLDTYQCRDCGLWHLGRSFKTARRTANQFVKPAPQSKMPSTGDLRRKLERMAREWERRDDYQRRQRFAALTRLIEAERAMVDAQNEYAETARQVTAMFLPAPR